MKFYQGRTGHCGKAEITVRLFFENAWHFKDIFREFEDFLKISIVFEDIFRKIEAFLK
jgi:hypothetical protein